MFESSIDRLQIALLHYATEDALCGTGCRCAGPIRIRRLHLLRNWYPGMAFGPKRQDGSHVGLRHTPARAGIQIFDLISPLRAHRCVIEAIMFVTWKVRASLLNLNLKDAHGTLVALFRFNTEKLLFEEMRSVLI